MKIYPMLETLSRVEDKSALQGLMRAHQQQATGELASKMGEALPLLEESPNVAAFLQLARKRDL